MPNPKLHKNYYRVDEVAEYFSISVRTVYRLIDKGDLKRTKIRGCLRVPAGEIERYEKQLEKQMEEV
ncbi:MAG: helix-turn-helix domain-containing protein [Deltaproteobacteria bacterium]|nr:helix-turn-helix domain-containing protein [Deltaproteobacteria bacterium]